MIAADDYSDAINWQCFYIALLWNAAVCIEKSIDLVISQQSVCSADKCSVCSRIPPE
jgi:hypothetical protein